MTRSESQRDATVQNLLSTRKSIANVTRHALRWIPLGKRNQGRQKTTCRRSTEAEVQQAESPRTGEDGYLWWTTYVPRETQGFLNSLKKTYIRISA